MYKILLVEDEVLIAMLLERQLKGHNIDLFKKVTSGEEALHIVQSEGVDLVLMDVRLSGKINGIEAAKMIKEICDIPIIFMTGYGTQEIKASAVKLNPLAFIEKPVDPKNLTDLIRQAQSA